MIYRLCDASLADCGKTEMSHGYTRMHIDKCVAFIGVYLCSSAASNDFCLFQQPARLEPASRWILVLDKTAMEGMVVWAAHVAAPAQVNFLGHRFSK
jgi:hypothetical protein